MPKYKVIVVEDYDSVEAEMHGEVAEWDLPYEYMVFDQRFDYDSRRWVVRELRQDRFVVTPNPGTRQGADPKKHQIP